MRFAILTILVLSYLHPAHAGAWLREEGKRFFALSYGITAENNSENSFYYEFGQTARTTLGFDATISRVPGMAKTGHGTVFLRRALVDKDRPYKLSYELGLGMSRAMGQETAHLKTGVSWGRGINWSTWSGWMSVNTSARWDLGDGDDLYKIESTLGLKFTDLATGILEFNLSHQGGETDARFEPSLLYTPKHSNFQIRFGTSSPLDDFEDTSLKIGIWRNF